MSEITTDGSSPRGYDRVQLSLGRIMMNNFLGGTAWGVGTFFGMTIVFGAVLWLLAQTGALEPLSDAFSQLQTSFESIQDLRNTPVER